MAKDKRDQNRAPARLRNCFPPTNFSLDEQWKAFVATEAIKNKGWNDEWGFLQPSFEMMYTTKRKAAIKGSRLRRTSSAPEETTTNTTSTDNGCLLPPIAGAAGKGLSASTGDLRSKSASSTGSALVGPSIAARPRAFLPSLPQPQPQFTPSQTSREIGWHATRRRDLNRLYGTLGEENRPRRLITDPARFGALP